MHKGSPATRGTGPIRYTIRIVFEISSFDQLKDILGNEFGLGGFQARIVQRDHFYVLRIAEFPGPEAAERFARVVMAAMIELSAQKGVTIWAQPISDIERDQPATNVRLRESFAEQDHPEWNRRANGSITDGGVWPNQSCILGEHERIWEYPMFWGKPVRQLTSTDFQAAVANASSRRNLERIFNDRRVNAATKFLNLSNGEPNWEIGYILFATLLEILSDDDGQMGVGKLIARCRLANGQTDDETEGQQLYRIRNKLVHEGNPLLDGKLLSQQEFSERYWRIRELAGQAVILTMNELSK